MRAGSQSVLWRLAGLLLVFALWPASPGLAQNVDRLWFVDVKVQGPLDGFELECPLGGVTRLDTKLLAGESRILRVPVPARVPLGDAGLENVTLPIARSVVGGREDSGTIEVTGWSEAQPAALFERLPPGLRARSIPAVADTLRHASLGGLLLLTFAFVAGLFLRRRRYLGILGGLVIAVALVGVSVREGGRRSQTVVVEADLTRDIWMEVRAGRNELSGRYESLQVVPEGDRIELDVSLLANSQRPLIVAKAQGKILVGRRRLEGPRRDLEARRNRLGDFQAAFLREPEGRWSARGVWKVGEALSPEELPSQGGKGVALASGGGSEGGSAGWVSPPGWLAAGVPGGEWALLGRLEDGRWVRATGFRVAEELGESVDGG